jgi:hypothetical protein
VVFNHHIRIELIISLFSSEDEENHLLLFSIKWCYNIWFCGIIIHKIIYAKIPLPPNITAKQNQPDDNRSIAKYSAKPPQTPPIILSVTER